MKTKNILYAIIGLLLSSFWTESTAKKPYYYFRTLDIKDGLSHNTVNTILQDRQGFMWFGTKDGLNLYDGLVFRTFQKENSSLGNNFITALHEDAEGNIWVGTDAGVYIYNPRLEKFTSFDIPIEDTDRTINRTITWIDSDPQKNVWIASDSQGLFHYDKKRNSLKEHSVKIGNGALNITRFWFEDNELWVSRYEDNLYHSGDAAHFTTFRDAEGEEPFKGTVINTCIKGLHNCIYIGSSNGLAEINLTTRKVRRLLNDYVRNICLRSDTELWVGTEQGIYIYDLETDKYIHLTTSESDDRYALSDNAIYTIFKDREGGMWIGSYFGGVNYYPHQYTYFEKYYPRDDMRYLGHRIREFCGSNDGTIWFGTEDKGLFHFNPADGTVTPFHHPALYHNIHGLCIDGDYLWVGTFAGGLNRINLLTREVRHYEKSEASNTLNANNIFSIYKSSTGELWIGTTSGLMRYNRKTDDFTRIPEMNKIFVYNILEDCHGKLWLATYSDGVFCYDLPQDKWKQYTRNPDNPNSLPYNKVISIFEDSRKQLWFMTQGAGFCRFRPETDDFIRYDMSQGFPGNTVYKMLEDNNGLLWLTTNKGLVSFHAETGTKHLYTTANGLLSNQFNYQSGYKDKTGTLYLGSVNGFISFNPATFTVNKQISPLVLTDFHQFNKRLPIGEASSPLSESITISESIELNADQNTFSLRAAVLNYQAPLSNTILYKLEGFDKEWYSTNGLNTRISYSNLPSGHYTLRVRGANSDGVWNPQERLLKIRVHPPFYLSWMAYVIYFIPLATVVTYIICYFRKRNLRKHRQAMEILEYEKERELYTSKINFFTNVAHEIRTPLTLIKSPLEHVLVSDHVNDAIKEDLEIMDLNTNRLLDLVNQLLDFRKTETKGFHLNFMAYNLSEILQKTYKRFIPLAREKGFEFTINVPDNLYAAVDKEGFTKIVSNLFTNAIKYGKSRIHVEMKQNEENETLQLSVTNDGEIVPLTMREEIFKPFIQYKGNSSYQVPGTGIGLALARSLAELHGGKLTMDDAADCNHFILTLPLHQAQTVHLLPTEPEKAEREEVIVSSEPGNPTTSTQFRYTLLVVEDNAEMNKFLVRQLSESYKVLTAANGVEALKILQESIINLIISDVMMPEMDGLELCDTVKTELDYSHIPIILLTAKTTLQSRIDGLKAGADAYIEKPFSMEYLKVSISSLLKNREQLQATFMHSPFTPTNNMVISKADEEFLKKLNNLIQTNMQNPEFSLIDMADQLCMSRSSLNRKIKGLLDLTPNDYLRIERLKKAAQLLKEGSCKINEVCYMVGFNTPSYFTKCFQKQFGVLPKEFITT